MIQNRKRIYPIATIKFMSSILIIFHHFHQCFGTGKMNIKFYGGEYLHLENIVELFFLISGLMMGRNNLKNSEKSFESFYFPKLFRLMPMSAISIFIFSLLEFINFNITGKWWMGIVPTFWGILRGCLLIFKGGPILENGINLNNPLWYICVLLICYNIYWLIIWIALKLKITPKYMFIIMIMIGISVLTYNFNLPFLNYYSGRGYMSFFTGVIFTDVFEWFEDNYRDKKVIFIPELIILFFIMSTVLNPQLFIADGQNYLVVFLFFPSLILTMVFSEFSQKLFNYKFFETLGKISFEMYVWHFPLFLFINICYEYMKIEIETTWSIMFTVLLLIIVFSTCTYLVERKITLIIEKNIKVKYNLKVHRS